MRVIVLLLSLALYGLATEYAIISSTQLQNLSKLQIRAIFLKKLTHLKGLHIIPVNLPYNNRLRSSFEKEFVKMGESRLKSYWSKQHYLGERPPIIMKSEESALKFIQNVEGGISYVSLDKVDSIVNILYKWSDTGE